MTKKHHQHTPREVRQALALTQVEMARSLGMSESGYRKFEIGIREGSGSTRIALAQLLEIDALQVKASTAEYWRVRALKAEAKLKKKK